MAKELIFDKTENEKPVRVGTNNPLPVTSQFSDSASIDAFGRLRVANPASIFDSQMQYDEQPLLWVDKEVGTASITHLPDESAVDLSIGTALGDRVVRQTREYFRYQPGKSQQVKATFTLGAGQVGTTKLVGYGDDSNGVFIGQDGSGVFVLLRSSVTGAVSDARKVYQENWNLDAMDGEGNSGINLDPETTQIFLTDIEWLGVGRVRVGLVHGGGINYVHEFLNANVNPTTYMTTANLPIRYEVVNTSAVAAPATLKQICAEVESEGGQQELSAYPFSLDLEDLAIPQGVGNAVVVFAARHQALFNSIENRAKFGPLSYTLTAEGGRVVTRVLYNPVITGGTWADTIPESIMESNATATGFSGGVQIASLIAATSGFNQSSPASATGDISSRLPFGLDIDGANPVILALVAWSNDAGVTASFTFNWEEVR